MGYLILLTSLGHYHEPPFTDLKRGIHSVQSIDPGDDAGYYAYLRSTVVDGDLDFFNEHNFWHFDALVPSTGYTANYWYIGAPILWAPFFLMGHASAYLYQMMGFSVSTDGYSFPYIGFTFAGSALEMWAGMLLCFLILKKLYSEKTALWTTSFTFFATCLPYFAFIRNRMSHTGDVLVSFAFVYLFLLCRERPDRPPYFYLLWGCLLGLLFDLRFISVAYALLPLSLIAEGWTKNSSDEKQQKLKNIGLGFCAFLVASSTQWIFWLRVHGEFSSLNPYTILVEPTFTGVLYSFAHMFTNGTRGLLWMEPVWIAGLIGLALLTRKDKWLGGMLWAVFLLFCVAPVVIMDPATFGQRYLLPALPILALGLGHLMESINNIRSYKIFCLFGCLACGWIYILILHYKTVFPHNDPQYILHVLQNFPHWFGTGSGFRVTSFPDLIVTGNFHLENYRDYFFLLLLPSLIGAGAAIFAIVSQKFLNQKPAFFQPRTFLKNSAITSMLFFSLLSLWISVRHPALSPDKSADRFRIAAVSKFLKNYPENKPAYKFLEEARRHQPNPELDNRIKGDIWFMQAQWQIARGHYQLAVNANPESPALLQMERIAILTGAKRLDPKWQEAIQKGEGTAVDYRMLALFALDAERNPVKAVHLAQSSLALDSNQPETAGLSNLIRQFNLQLSLARKKGVPLSQIPPQYFHLLNTSINQHRLTLPLLQNFG